MSFLSVDACFSAYRDSVSSIGDGSSFGPFLPTCETTPRRHRLSSRRESPLMKKPVLRFLQEAGIATLVSLGFVATPALAADGDVSEVEVRASRIDRWHDALYLKVQDWAQALDHKFIRDGQRPEPTPSSPFRIATDAEVVQHQEGGTEFRGRLDVDLLLQVPNLEKRLKIFVTSDTVEESPSIATS
ncbi:MAG: hypothetical protein ABW136_00840, partial [Steroidobacteraceae bacterium]